MGFDFFGFFEGIVVLGHVRFGALAVRVLAF